MVENRNCIGNKGAQSSGAPEPRSPAPLSRGQQVELLVHSWVSARMVAFLTRCLSYRDVGLSWDTPVILEQVFTILFNVV